MQATRAGNCEAQRTLTKQIKKSIRNDRRQANIDMVAHDLDPRDRWLGLKCLRTAIDPIPYAMKDTNQQRVPMRRRAQAAAEFLADKIWGNPGGESTPSSPSEPPGKIFLDDLHMKTCEFNLQDLIMAIRKMKRRKTPWARRRPYRILQRTTGASTMRDPRPHKLLVHGKACPT